MTRSSIKNSLKYFLRSFTDVESGDPKFINNIAFIRIISKFAKLTNSPPGTGSVSHWSVKKTETIN